MRHEEVEPVVRMWRRSRDESRPWLEARMSYTQADDLGFFRDVLMREAEIWVVAEAASPCGLLALCGTYVHQLYVDPSVQRTGVGSALLAHAKLRSPQGLWLYTHQWNRRARTFYEREGFRAVAFGVSPPPECEPDVRYDWRGNGALSPPDSLRYA